MMSWRWFSRPRMATSKPLRKLVRRYDRNVFRIAQHITHEPRRRGRCGAGRVPEGLLEPGPISGPVQVLHLAGAHCGQRGADEVAARQPGRVVSLDEDVKTDEDSLPREVADWSPNPEQQYNQAELRDILTRTIQGLPTSFRTVFVLRDVEGLSTEETAEALDLSIPAVKSRLLRARLQLRERLNRYFQKRWRAESMDKP